MKEKEIKEELKRLGIEPDKENILVLKAIYERPKNFWTVDRFRRALIIATADIGVNSSEAIRKKLNGKYRVVYKVFERFNEEFFGKKLKWREALEYLGVEIKREREDWSEGREKLLRRIRERNIRSYSDLKKKDPAAFAWYHRYIEPSGVSVDELVIEAGLIPKSPEEKGNAKRSEVKSRSRKRPGRPIKSKRRKEKDQNRERKLYEKLEKEAVPVDGFFCPKDKSLLKFERIGEGIFAKCPRCGTWYKRV